jgi:hypothetical protein
MAEIELSENAYKELIQSYAKNPVAFCREICLQEPYPWQVRFLEALLTRKFLCRPSGHSTGKTFITSVAMLWMLLFYPECHIRATSATYDQLKSVLWNTLRTIINGSAVAKWVSLGDSKIVNKFYPMNWILALAWSKDKPQAWAGEHCASPVGVFDECSDIDSTVFESWFGSSHHEGSRTILLGQPRLRQGMLFKSATDPKYDVEHISCLDVPSVPRSMIEDAAREYGENSDFYRIRILGQFPSRDNAMMFPDAYGKAVEDLNVSGFPVGGLDVAGGGNDNSVLYIRKGYVVMGRYESSEADHTLLGRWALNILISFGCEVLAMDTNGIGYKLGQDLPRMTPRLTVVPVVGSKKARNEKKYHNRRSEAYGRLSEAWPKLRFASSGNTPDSLRNLGRQLAATRMFFDKDMRISVLPKDDIKKELKGESPDDADALAYTQMADESNAPRDSSQSQGSGNFHVPQDIWNGKSSQDIVNGKSSYSIW